MKKAEKGPVFTAVIARADQPNQNGTVFPREVLERAIARGDFNNGYVVDALDPRSVKSIAGYPERVWIDGDEVKAEIRLLKTPMGEAAAILQEAGNASYAIGGDVRRSEDGEITDLKAKYVSVKPGSGR